MDFNRSSVRLVDTGQLIKRYSTRQSELQRRQRKYRKDLEKPICIDRNEMLQMESYKDMAGKLRNEKDTLKTNIWNAIGTFHTTRNSRALASIKCLLDCYGALTDEVQRLKKDLTNLKTALNVIEKEVYNLKINEKTRNKQNLEKAQKRLHNLEDHFEDMIKRESDLFYESEKLRRIICELLQERKMYSLLYTQYIQKLNEGKKYLTDLLDYALNQIEMVINMYEKMELSARNYITELDRRKLEMNELQRKQLAREIKKKFTGPLSQPRQLAPVPQKHIRRTLQIHNKYLRKINLYSKILRKIRKYTDSYDVRSVIVNFQEQESLYYSYFNYANEISYRITLLNNSMGRLFKEIHFLKLNNRDKQRNQIEYLNNLNIVLEEKRKNNKKLRKMSESQDERIGKLFEALTLIRDQTRTDGRLLHEPFFVDQQEINLLNMREQMKVIEKRIYSIVAATYWLERRNDEYHRPYTSVYLVKGLDKKIEYRTALDLIVPTTQCSECAEVEVKNLENDKDGQIASITPLHIMKNYIAEKVIQPDMQYRLHDIQHCRLPRSRYLAHRQS